MKFLVVIALSLFVATAFATNALHHVGEGTGIATGAVAGPVAGGGFKLTAKELSDFIKFTDTLVETSLQY